MIGLWRTANLPFRRGRGLAAIALAIACGGGSTKSITSGGGGTPLLEEDFSEYSGTANMLADPRGIYSVTEDVLTTQMALDQSVGYGSSSKSMRYDFPDRTGDGGRCTDFTIGRNMKFPSNLTEVWVEVVAKFDNTFTTVAPGAWGCTSAAAYKFILPRTDVSRFQLVAGIFGTSYTFGYPGNEEPADWAMEWTPFDGQWHTYRLHVKCGNGTGLATLWVDGVKLRDFENVTTTASDIYGLALGRNVNQGPDHLQSMWWGKVTIWDQDPQW